MILARDLRYCIAIHVDHSEINFKNGKQFNLFIFYLNLKKLICSVIDKLKCGVGHCSLSMSLTCK